MAFNKPELASLLVSQTANQQLVNEILRMIEIASLSKANLEHGTFGAVFEAVLYNTLSYTEDSDGNCLTVTITGNTYTFPVFRHIIKVQRFFDIGWSY